MRTFYCFLFLVGFLLAAPGLSLGSTFRATRPPSSPVSAPGASKTATEYAYMDLRLTTRDEYGGEISVDEAFSLYFRTDATDGWDRYDASKMLPRGDTWAAIAFKGLKGGEETLKARESRPMEDSVQVVDIKLIQKNMPAATYTIDVQSWDNVPSHWSLRLKSQALDTTFVIDGPNDTASFKLGSPESNTTSSQPPLAKSTSDTTHISLAGEVGPNTTTLPVELSAFSATLHEDQATLQWETASETNNSGFAIQHRRTGSTTPEAWSRLGFVEGHGTTNRAREYRFTTASLEPGTHVFRLKQIDRDGTAHLSAQRSVVRQLNTTVDLTTAPNPFTEQVSVSLTARSDQPVTIQVIDMLGRVVQKRGPISLSANAPTRLKIDGTGLSSGQYLLRVRGETFSETRRLTRVR